jgi:hypothetical protein
MRAAAGVALAALLGPLAAAGVAAPAAAAAASAAPSGPVARAGSVARTASAAVAANAVLARPGARPGSIVVQVREGAEAVTFAAEAPEGWRGDVAAARRKGAHLVFFPRERAVGVQPATIRVRVNPKSDEDTAGDLAAELDGYRGSYPELTSAELSAHHPVYGTVAAVLFRPGLFYEYIAYLNPGRGIPWSVAVTLSKPRAPATSGELAAFEAVVRSIAVTQ